MKPRLVIPPPGPEPEIVIDSDVPLPAGNGPRMAYSRAVRRLEVGQSFFIAISESKASSMRMIAARLGWKLTVRKVRENGINGLRIWRVS